MSLSTTSPRKPAITYKEKIALLKERGLSFDNEKTALFYLQHINYYRLSAYWKIFELEPDDATHQFKPNSHFSEVLKLYYLDRKLRLLLLDAIERIEISLRTQWSYTLAHHHNAFVYTDSSIARDCQRWEKNLKKLHEQINYSKEEFITTRKETNPNFQFEIWIVSEVMSIGLLSKWCRNLSCENCQTKIALTYRLTFDDLCSWLQQLCEIRNHCAHHSRVWNRKFTKSVRIPKSPSAKSSIRFNKTASNQTSNKLYNSLLVLLYFMDIIAPNHFWRDELKALLQEHSNYLSHMGFPGDWEQQAIWQKSHLVDSDVSKSFASATP